MWRVVWVILGLWLLAIVAIVVSKAVVQSHPCQRGIISNYGAWNLSLHVRDFRTGIEAPQSDSRPQQLSPNRQYRYTISSPNLNTIYLNNIITGQTQQFYSSADRLSAYWSADSDSLYILERTEGELIHLSIDTGEIISEYGTIDILDHSANRHSLSISIPTDNGSQLAIIDTSSGQLTNYDYVVTATNVQFLWSADEQWLAIQAQNTISIFDSSTGQHHPQFTSSLSGTNAVWTQDSLWFSQIENQSGSIWNASLSDGSMTIEQDHALDFAVSLDNRWLLYEDQTGASLHLADREMGISYPLIENIDPLVFVWQADFSDDSNCLVIISRDNAYQRPYEVTIYDLENIQSIYHLSDLAVGENSPNSHYDFYEAD